MSFFKWSVLLKNASWYQLCYFKSQISFLTQVCKFCLHFLVSLFDQFVSIGVSCRLWGTFLADVVIQMLGTDYARILRAIYAFAQVIYDLVCMILWSWCCKHAGFMQIKYNTVELMLVTLVEFLVIDLAVTI